MKSQLFVPSGNRIRDSRLEDEGFWCQPSPCYTLLSFPATIASYVRKIGQTKEHEKLSPLEVKHG